MKFPFILSIPHCSVRVPEEIRSTLALTDSEILDSVDMGTAEIFGVLPAQFIFPADWNRLVVDLNRASDRHDAKGVVAQVDYHGRFIYRPECIPDETERSRRIKKYYWPYHKRLVEALECEDIKMLFDCHSLYGTGPKEAPDAGIKRKDIILSNNGDKYGNEDKGLGTKTTCSTKFLHMMIEAFQKSGFSVSVNDPYRGGYITTHYGQKYIGAGKMAVQIEINQDLFIKSGDRHPLPEKLEDVKRRVFMAFEKIGWTLSNN